MIGGEKVSSLPAPISKGSLPSLTPSQEWLAVLAAAGLAAIAYTAWPQIGGPFVVLVVLSMLVYASDKGFLTQ